jgi:hypothetical protein
MVYALIGETGRPLRIHIANEHVPYVILVLVSIKYV